MQKALLEGKRGEWFLLLFLRFFPEVSFEKFPETCDLPAIGYMG